MNKAPITRFFSRLLKFLIRQACGFTFKNFPDADDDEERGEKSRIGDAIEIYSTEPPQNTKKTAGGRA